MHPRRITCRDFSGLNDISLCGWTSFGLSVSLPVDTGPRPSGYCELAVNRVCNYVSEIQLSSLGGAVRSRATGPGGRPAGTSEGPPHWPRQLGSICSRRRCAGPGASTASPTPVFTVAAAGVRWALTVVSFAFPSGHWYRASFHELVGRFRIFRRKATRVLCRF